MAPRSSKMIVDVVGFWTVRNEGEEPYVLLKLDSTHNGIKMTQDQCFEHVMNMVDDDSDNLKKVVIEQRNQTVFDLTYLIDVLGVEDLVVQDVHYED